MINNQKNTVELYKQLEKQSYELKFAMNNTEKAIEESIKILDERMVSEGGMNEETKQLYIMLKDFFAKQQLLPEDIDKINSIEEKIGDLYSKAIEEYQNTEVEIKNILGGEGV